MQRAGNGAGVTEAAEAATFRRRRLSTIAAIVLRGRQAMSAVTGKSLHDWRCDGETMPAEALDRPCGPLMRHDPARRAARRRGDGGDGVVERIA